MGPCAMCGDYAARLDLVRRNVPEERTHASKLARLPHAPPEHTRPRTQHPRVPPDAGRGWPGAAKRLLL